MFHFGDKRNDLLGIDKSDTNDNYSHQKYLSSARQQPFQMALQNNCIDIGVKKFVFNVMYRPRRREQNAWAKIGQLIVETLKTSSQSESVWKAS